MSLRNRRPLTIAMIASVFAPSIGGIQTETRQLARSLAARGVRVLLMTRHHRGLPRREELDGFTVLRLGHGDGPRPVATASAVAATWNALRQYRREIDLVHAHQMLSPMTIALSARTSLGLPSLVTPHACGPIGDVMQLAHQRRFTGALRLQGAKHLLDGFIAISQVIRSELLAIGIPSQRIHQIPNGIDTSLFRPADSTEKRTLRQQLRLPVDGPLVISVGRLAPEKGVDVLLRSWVEVIERVPQARLLIVGDGDERTRLETLSSSLGITQSVQFTGAIHEPAPYLRSAGLFALPSRTEGLPVALLEALACGLPVAATDVGGTPEVLSNSGVGTLVPPEQPEAMSHALLSMLRADETWREREGASGRELVLNRYAIETVADRTLALYEQVISRRARVGVSARTEPC